MFPFDLTDNVVIGVEVVHDVVDRLSRVVGGTFEVRDAFDLLRAPGQPLEDFRIAPQVVELDEDHVAEAGDVVAREESVIGFGADLLRVGEIVGDDLVGAFVRGERVDVLFNACVQLLERGKEIHRPVEDRLQDLRIGIVHEIRIREEGVNGGDFALVLCLFSGFDRFQVPDD